MPNENYRGLSYFILWTILVASFFFVIGFATPGWSIVPLPNSSTQQTFMGLWQVCSCAQAHETGWYKGTQAMEILGLLCLVGGFVCFFIYSFVDSISRNIMIVATVILLLAAVLFIIIGVIIFGAEIRVGLNYSFVFAIVSAILLLIAAILGIIEMKNNNGNVD